MRAMRARRVVLLLAGLGLLGTPRASADSSPRQPGGDALHYVFRGTLGDQSDAIEGEAAVTLRLLASGLREVALDLTSSANGKGMAVRSVSRDGKPAAYTHRDDTLRIALSGDAAASGQELTFLVRYGGVPAGGLRLIKNIHGERTILTENLPDNTLHWLAL